MECQRRVVFILAFGPKWITPANIRIRLTQLSKQYFVPPLAKKWGQKNFLLVCSRPVLPVWKSTGRPSCSHRLHHILQTFAVDHVAGCYWTPTVEKINCHRRGGGGDAVEAIHRGGDIGVDDCNKTRTEPGNFGNVHYGKFTELGLEFSLHFTPVQKCSKYYPGNTI